MTLPGYERFAHGLSQQRAVLADAFIIDGVMHESALAFASDQSGLPQNTQMLGNGRLGDFQFLGQGTDAQKAPTVAFTAAKHDGLAGEQFQQPQTRWIGKGLEDIGQ